MKSRLLQSISSLILAISYLGFSSNPPTGYTGAPFDGHCDNCHNGDNRNGFAGQLLLSGLPAVITPNTDYTITLTLKYTAGNPAQGGFQLVVVDGLNNNAGNLTPLSSETNVETAGNRKYVEHVGAKTFSSDTIQWQFRWTAPATVAGNVVQVYYIGNFGNGGGSSGDFPIAAAQALSFSSNPAPLAVSIENTAVSCFGGADGAARANPSGGVPPYQYLWSNGQTTQTAVNLPAGSYSATVTDSENKAIIVSTQVLQPSILEAIATVSGAITCLQASVAVFPQATGGVWPYRFVWSNGQTGNSAVYKTGGPGSIIATDAKGCTKSADFTIPVDTLKPIAKAVANETLHCNKKEVQLDGTGSSTGPDIGYFWSSPNGHIVGDSTTLNPVVDLPGTYRLQVQNTLNGCLSESFTIVRRLDPVFATLQNQQNTSCPEKEDGSAVVAAQGGDGIYRYAWNTGVSTPGVSQLGAGVYTATATDGNGCSATISAVIAVADTMQPQLNCPQDTAVFETDTVYYAFPTISDNCALGNAQIFLAGGLPSGRLFPAGVSTQTFTLIDASGNRNSCSFSVNVKPVVSSVLDQALEVFRIKPNPAITVLFLDLTDYHILKGQILDSCGRIVRDLRYGELQNGIDVSGLPGGIYFLKITNSDGKTAVKRWVKA